MQQKNGDVDRPDKPSIWAPLLDPDAFHKLVSKKMCFILFNIGTTIYCVLCGQLRWNFTSIFGFCIALLLMNGIALFSARHFPNWK